MDDAGALAVLGAGFFGLVIGWVTYRTLRRREGAAQLSDIATVIGAVGGAAVTKLFDDPDLFGAYSIGLAIGFFSYLAIGLAVEGTDSASKWMGD
jgi:ABC-type sulfate transport system permease component